MSDSVGGWTGDLLIFECQINTAKERKRSKPSGAQLRKIRKEEEEKRAKYKGMQLCSLCMITVSMSSMKG